MVWCGWLVDGCYFINDMSRYGMAIQKRGNALLELEGTQDHHEYSISYYARNGYLFRGVE